MRSKTVLGPYEAYENNPILTQRDLPPGRANPITSVGHAAFVQDGEDQWWASFLGVRPYEGDYYNTGRETFLLPVTWEDGWPSILDSGKVVPYVMNNPALPTDSNPSISMSGNFTVLEDFDSDILAPYWLQIRVPKQPWYNLNKGALELTSRNVGLGDGGQPSFLGRRQQHQNASVTTLVNLESAKAGDEAGLTVFQNDEYYYALGIVEMVKNGRVVQLRKRAGKDDAKDGVLVAEMPIKTNANAPVYLKITAQKDLYSFDYAVTEGMWISLAKAEDGKILSTRTAGGFVGAVFGMYALNNGEEN